MPLFRVPKFIEMETKIFWVFNFKQVILILVTVSICILIYNALPRLFSFFLILVIGGFGCALAVFKVNEIPFYQVILGSFKFLFAPKTFFWRKGKKISSFTFKEMELKKEKRGEIKIKKKW